MVVLLSSKKTPRGLDEESKSILQFKKIRYRGQIS